MANRVIQPNRYVVNPKVVIKDKITTEIDINDEVKILRETLAKVLAILDVADTTEFLQYNETIKNIKTEVASSLIATL